MYDYAQWRRDEYGPLIGMMRYSGYPTDVQFRLAKRDAMKDGANYLMFNGSHYERHGSRWYRMH